MFRKLVKGCSVSKTLPYKARIFNLWLEYSNSKTQKRIQKANSRYLLLLKQKVILAWEKQLRLQRNYKELGQEALCYHYKSLLVSVLKGWRQVVFHEKNLIEFRIESVRRFLRRVLSNWKIVVRIKAQKNYLSFRILSFRDNHSKLKAFSGWKSTVKYNQKVRKLQLYLNYWKKVFFKSKEFQKEFTESCRQRHLSNYYFKRLVNFCRFSQMLKKSRRFRTKLIFASFKRQTKKSVLRKHKQEQTKNWLESKYTNKLVK